MTPTALQAVATDNVVFGIVMFSIIGLIFAHALRRIHDKVEAIYKHLGLDKEKEK